jgi:hypothetical protein
MLYSGKHSLALEPREKHYGGIPARTRSVTLKKIMMLWLNIPSDAS